MIKLPNKRIKQFEATCLGSCKHTKVVTRKNGDAMTCAINKKDLPAAGRFDIPWWCSTLVTYYPNGKDRNKKKK